MAAAGVATPRDFRSRSAHSTPTGSRDRRREHALNHTQPPNYNIYGHHHNLRPYKDRSHVDSVDVHHPRWLGSPPQIRSRSELLQARKASRIPDSSYDFDGDGAIGQLDYFVGRSFDKDADGRLSRSERLQAEQALVNGFLDKYMRGLDSTGHRDHLGPLQQKRGVIIGPDNQGEACNDAYGPHFNAHVTPPHPTQAALKLSRLAERRGAGVAVGERWERAVAPVREPMPPDHKTNPRTSNIAHIRERAEADHQLSRARAGLLPVPTAVNPERESQTIGLGHESSPVIATRSQLHETRKELMKRDCEDQRARGEDLFVPLSVRRKEKEDREFEFRQPRGETRTLTVLKDERRRNRIEYDMANFQFPDVMPREYPRYADNPDVPFWAVGQEDRSQNDQVVANGAVLRGVSEPQFKVNHVPWDHQPRELHADLPDAAHQAGANLSVCRAPAYGSQTVKRFTSEILERGLGRNKPRLFNSIQPVPVGSNDLVDLDLTSSMEPVRTAALRRQAEERKKSGTNPRCSRLWSENQLLDSTVTEAKTTTAAPERTQAMPKRYLEMPSADSMREPRSYSSPDLRQASQTGVRCGGFHKLDWGPKFTATRSSQSQPRRVSRTHASGTVATPAPPL